MQRRHSLLFKNSNNEMKKMKTLNLFIFSKCLKGQNPTYFTYVSMEDFYVCIPSCIKCSFKVFKIHLHLGVTVLQKKVGQSITMFRCKYPSTCIFMDLHCHLPCSCVHEQEADILSSLMGVHFCSLPLSRRIGVISC